MAKTLTPTSTGVTDTGTTEIVFNFDHNQSRIDRIVSYKVTGNVSPLVPGSNTLVVTQAGEDMFHTYNSGESGSRTKTYEESTQITFTGYTNARYLKFTNGTISSLTNFSFKENSSGSYVGVSGGDQYHEVSSFGGRYQYTISFTAPSGLSSGTKMITIYASDTPSDSGAVTKQYSLTVAQPAFVNKTINIVPVCKRRYTSGSEVISGHVGYVINSTSSDKSYSFNATSLSSYSSVSADSFVLTEATGDTFRIGIGAGASNYRGVTTPISVYASSASQGTQSNIENGVFINSTYLVGSVDNNTWNDIMPYNNMLQLNAQTIYTQLGLTDGTALNIYLDIQTEDAVDASLGNNSHGYLEYNSTSDTFGSLFGVCANIVGSSTSDIYNLTASLYVNPSSSSASLFTLNSVNNGVFLIENGVSISANGSYVFRGSRDSDVIEIDTLPRMEIQGFRASSYIKLTNAPTASDSDIISAINSHVSDVKVRLVLANVTRSTSQSFDLSIYRSEN